MSTVREILKAKNNNFIYSIYEDQEVFEAINIMSNKNIGAVLVKSRDEDLAGLITERDYARNVILKNRSSKETKVKEIMNTSVITVGLDQTIETCMTIMSENKIRHIPVLEDFNLIGLISMGDIVKKVITDREFLIDQFIYYITGNQNSGGSSFYKPFNY